MKQRILDYLENNKEDLFRTLSELVKIDTQNFKSHGNENNGQDYLEKICNEIGLITDRFAPDSIHQIKENPDYMSGRDADKRENLVATLEGKNKDKNIMLAAHMDTVLHGDRNLWDDDPFSGGIKDGRIYGLGVGDDKSGLAVAWYVLKCFKECGFVPEKNVLLASYVDEEGGGGNGALAAGLKYPCDFAINLDGSRLEAEAFGGGCFKLDIRSVENDLSIASVFDVFTGMNIIKEKLEVLNNFPGTSIRFSDFEGGKTGEKSGVMNIAIYTDMNKEQAQTKLDELVAQVKPQLDEIGLETEGFKLITRYFHYGKTPEDSEELKTLVDIVTKRTGTEPDTRSTCLSDLGLIMKYGCGGNAVNFGIQKGYENGGGPHQPNECVDCESLLEYSKTIALFLMRL